MNAVESGLWTDQYQTRREEPELQQRERDQREQHEAPGEAPQESHGASRAQVRDDRRGVGPHAAPDVERFGGLLDEHAEAVGGARALARARTRETASTCRTPCRRRARRARRCRRAAPACRRSRPAEVALMTRSKRSAARALRSRARQSDAARAGAACGNARTARRPCRPCGSRRRAPPALVEQRPAHAVRCAARAHQQDRAAAQARCRRLTVRSRTSPTPSVLSPSIASPSKESVLTACACSARARARCRERERAVLERERHVEAARRLRRGSAAPSVSNASIGAKSAT